MHPAFAWEAAELIREIKPEGVDVVLDTIGGESLERAVDAVRDEGRIVSIAEPPTSDHFRQRGIDATYVFVRPDGEELEEVAELIESGRLIVELAEVLPLEQAARAHELSEGGHVRGKLVLRIPD